jgi:hypothetical protein
LRNPAVVGHLLPTVSIPLSKKLFQLVPRAASVFALLEKFSDVHDGFLWVVPQKTEGSTLVKLKIRVGDELAALLSQTRNAVLSQHVVHGLPDRARPSDKRVAARQ